MTHARYIILTGREQTTPLFPLEIQDVGPWDRHPTVTNDAEWVVADLARKGLLPEGRRLFYLNSDGQRDELLHADGRFVGFAP
jgi:hypothetical protein